MPNYSKKVVKLFNELIEQGEGIKKTCKRLYFAGNKKTIAPETFEAWKTNCLSLLKSTFGASSSHCDDFSSLKFFDYYNSTQIYLGILKGAKSDLEKGYFFHKDLMLSVNIYDSLIKRAREYAENDNELKARLILETTLLEILTRICDNKRIKFERKDNLVSLGRKLLAEDIITPEVRGKLESIEKLLSESADVPLDAELFREAVDWIQSFLNDYLGSQILILN